MKTNFNHARNLREITAPVDAYDTTAADLFTLPKGCRVVDWIANVQDAFGSETLNVGTSSTGGYFATGISLAAIDKATVIHFTPGVELTETTTVQGTISGGTGAVALTCIYSLPQQAS